MNYRPGILPGSQDMLPVIEETTGLYGITSESLKKYRCRIGRKSYIQYEGTAYLKLNFPSDRKYA